MGRISHTNLKNRIYAKTAFHGHDTGDIGTGVLFVIDCDGKKLYCSKFSPVKKTKGLPLF